MSRSRDGGVFKNSSYGHPSVILTSSSDISPHGENTHICFTTSHHASFHKEGGGRGKQEAGGLFYHNTTTGKGFLILTDAPRATSLQPSSLHILLIHQEGVLPFSSLFSRPLLPPKKHRLFLSGAFFFGLFFAGQFFFPYEWQQQYSVLYDRHHQVIVGHKHEPFRSFDDIPPLLVETLVEIEDKRFWSHPGIDLIAVIRATWHNITHNTWQGASTIDQQVIKLDQKAFARSWHQKISEMRWALHITLHMDKQDIMTTYINTMEFANNVTGRKSACQLFWGQSCHTLNREQLLLTLASAQRGLSLYQDRDAVVQRASLYTDVDLLDAQKNTLTPLTHAPLDPRVEKVAETTHTLSPDRLQQSHRSSPSLGDSGQTSFDLGIYQAIDNIIHATAAQRQQYNIQSCCVTIVNQKGDIVSMNMCSSRGADETSSKINSCLVQRQTGSAVKPFVYSLAFERFDLDPYDTIIDEPVSFGAVGSLYTPKNFDLSYHGEVTYAYALGNSLNIPAVKLVERIGVENVLSFLQDTRDTYTTLPENNPKTADNVGLSVGLGTYEISPFAFTQMWRFFGETQHQYRESNQHILAILSDPANKVVSFGQDNFLSQAGWALKTGTSRKFIDGWICGYHQQKKLAMCLRMGNQHNEPMMGASSEMGSYLWALMTQALEEYDTK